MKYPERAATHQGTESKRKRKTVNNNSDNEADDKIVFERFNLCVCAPYRFHISQKYYFICINKRCFLVVERRQKASALRFPPHIYLLVLSYPSYILAGVCVCVCVRRSVAYCVLASLRFKRGCRFMHSSSITNESKTNTLMQAGRQAHQHPYRDVCLYHR